MTPEYTSIVANLESTTPFVGPEALERRSGMPIKLRLGANESPFGASPNAIEAMKRQAESTQNYGDPEGYLVRQELARQLGVPMDTIVLGAGIDELLGLCCRLFVEPGEIVVTTLGSYPTFDYGAAGCGSTITGVAYFNEAADLQALADAAVRSRAKIVYLANPDNPSGSWHSAERVSWLRTHLPPGCVLLLDEAYLEFAPGAPAIDPADPQVIRFRTFSKAHGMAGARIAYTVSTESHARALNKIRFHFGVNCVAQAGALASLLDPNHVPRVVAASAAGRALLAQWMIDLGQRPLPSHTNFLTVDVGAKARADAILPALLDQGIFIRKPGKPPLDGCIRITIGRPEQQALFATVFEDVLANL
jgi:histidinol-phosphate aminotransferase